MLSRILKGVSACIFITTNGMFLYKYAERAVAYPLWATLLYVVFLITFLVFANRAEQFIATDKKKNIFTGIIITITLVAWAISFYKIDPYKITIDRWYMTKVFWDNVHHGIYPWHPAGKAYSDNIPSTLPFYFLLSYPFYLLGETGLYSMVMYLVYLVVIRKHTDAGTLLKTVLLLFFSVAMWWEITTRSTVFLNAVLVVVYMFIAEKTTPKTRKELLFTGIGAGLVLSTRTIVAIPLFIYFIYHYKSNFKGLFLSGAIALLVFAATIIPFYFLDKESFFKYNPLMVQSGFSPGIWLMLFCFAMSVVAGFVSRNIYHIFSFSAIVLFVIVFSAMLFSEGAQLKNQRFSFDISHFIFLFPLIIPVILSRKETITARQS